MFVIQLATTFFSGSRQLSITELVVPSQLRSGDNVELECRIDRGEVPYDALIVKWWFTPLNDSDSHNPLQLYQRLEKGAPQAPHHKHFNTRELFIYPCIVYTIAFSKLKRSKSTLLTTLPNF